MSERESDNHAYDYHKGVCCYCGGVGIDWEDKICEERKKRNEADRGDHTRDINRLCKILSQLSSKDQKFLVQMAFGGDDHLEEALGLLKKRRQLEERDF